VPAILARRAGRPAATGIELIEVTGRPLYATER
jgi:hypothetical protein